MGEPLIKIPEDGSPVTGMPAEVQNRFDKIDTILITVVIAVVMALVSMLIAVFGIFLDQMRYNNAAYKEYSQRTESVGIAQQINQELLDKIMKNQELIIEAQKQILKK